MRPGFAILIIILVLFAMAACDTVEPRFAAGDRVTFKLGGFYPLGALVLDANCGLTHCLYNVRLADGTVMQYVREFEMESGR